MDTEKFTPGKWRRAMNKSRNGKTMRGLSHCRIENENGVVIGFTVPQKSRLEQVANTNLLSTAKEMYEFIGWIGSVEGQCAILTKDPESVRKAHSILKKARGEK